MKLSPLTNGLSYNTPLIEKYSFSDIKDKISNLPADYDLLD